MARLENRVDVNVYQINQWRDGEKVTTSGPLGVGIVPSQGGLDIAYQPASIGVRNGHLLQVFARLLWGTAPDSASMIDEETLQGGVGVRYQPWSSVNVIVSGEKRFALGDAAVDDWLLRAGYSRERGAMPLRAGAHERYSWFYADGALAFGATDSRIVYGELREGRTWNVGDVLALSPHVVLSGQAQNDVYTHDSSSNVGLGVSARVYFGETFYTAPRGALELTVQAMASLSGDGNGWRAIGALRF